jgi:hypothetical protein
MQTNRHRQVNRLVAAASYNINMKRTIHMSIYETPASWQMVTTDSSTIC